MQHLPVVFDIWRITFLDDDVGGAVETGTYLARGVAGNLSMMGPSQMSLEQGLEVPALADIFLRPRPGSVVIRERDQLQVVGPPAHPNLGEYWRIESVDTPPMHPANRKSFFTIKASRVDRTRTEVLQ
ncbi:MAG: hypothetical protein K940chlam2_00010 [Chlamydiae bacterium]|nr:hypothetical protein [Chlamydiota bacterium]